MSYGVSRNFVQHMAKPLACLLMALTFCVMAGTVKAEAATRVLALGDSLTAGYNLPADAMFPVVLERRLRAAGHDVEVVNAGVSGDTAQGGLERLDWALADKVDAVIVELGANDMLRGIDPALTEKSLDEILSKLSERKIPVLLAGMLAAPGLGKDYGTQFSAIYPRLAQKYGALLYPFFLDGIVGDNTLNQPDGMHPTRAGVEIIVERIMPKVTELLERAKSKTSQPK
ncbi:acyl-CoA thioesterase-1 [Beijerinckia sp. GAS462]|nr:acyl-CoA thioesterase-1 [Beijerinckia sp. GAS462]SED07546.1 acyl-CoA thioesterase-1 [Beijerinckia sp. 28-YEA-48]